MSLLRTGLNRDFRRKQLGQAAVEYLVVCSTLALIFGVGMANHDSILWQLLEAFQTGYQKFSYALSLPI